MSNNSRKVVLVQSSDIRQTRAGENFCTLMLNLGKHGNFSSIGANLWQSDRYADDPGIPQSGQFIEVVYKESEYNGRKQWVIEAYDILAGPQLESVHPDFVQPARIDAAFYKAKLEELIDSTDMNRIPGMVLREVFDQAEFRRQFFRAPAARTRHQNYPGGLLEHTLNVTTGALALADAYRSGGPGGLSFNCERAPIDTDLLTTAGLLHDIGKLETYQFNPIPDRTDADWFEGHLAIGYAVVREIVAPLKDAPPYPAAIDEIEKLLNCILGHHGILEFGSPVMPGCIEAFLLAQADMTDARVAEMVTLGNEALRRNSDTRWIRFHEFQGRFFVGDWPDPPPIDQKG